MGLSIESYSALCQLTQAVSPEQQPTFAIVIAPRGQNGFAVIPVALQSYDNYSDDLFRERSVVSLEDVAGIAADLASQVGGPIAAVLLVQPDQRPSASNNRRAWVHFNLETGKPDRRFQTFFQQA